MYSVVGLRDRGSRVIGSRDGGWVFRVLGLRV